MSVSTWRVPEAKQSPLVTAGRCAIFLTALTPIIVSPGFLFPFVTTRNVFFRVCVEIALALVLLTGVKRLREAEGSVDPILKWFFIYLIAIAFAAVFGLSPWHSLFGDFERMGGVWAWLHLFLFFLVLRVVMRRSDWNILFRCTLVAADAVVTWGAFEFLPASIRNPFFETTLAAGSTIGNAGLLAPYLLLSFGVCCLLLLEERRWWWRIFAAFSALVLLFGIAGSRNRSSELGLLVGTAVGAAVFFFLTPSRRRVAQTYLLIGALSVAFAIIGGYALGRRAPEVAEHFGGRWMGFLTSPVDHSRTIEWKIALEGFRDRPLLGYGPENHQIVSSHHFDPSIYEIVSGGTFDRTHNAWLELLATSGLIGTLAMLGVWVAAAAMVRTAARQKTIPPGEAAILSGALAGYAAYLTFWFFDLNSVLVWVGLLAFLAFRARGPLDVFAVAETVPETAPRKPILAWGIVALIALAGYLHGIIPLIAAHDLSDASGEGPFEQRLDAFQRVMNSAAPQTMHTFPIYYRFLRSTSSLVNKPGADPVFRREFDLALQRGMIEADRHISRNGEDDRSYVDAARLSMLAGRFYLDIRYMARARDELLHAIRISPRRPDTRVLLSSVYLTFRDSSKASAQLDSAMSLAPFYGAGYFFAAKLSLARNGIDSASSLLATALQHNFNGTEDFFAGVILGLEQRGEFLRAARLNQDFLEHSYGSFSGWLGGNTATGLRLTPLAENLANRLPIQYLNGGEPRLAIKAATAFAGVKPQAKAAAIAFASDIGSSRNSRWKGKDFLFDSASNGAVSSRP